MFNSSLSRVAAFIQTRLIRDFRKDEGATAVEYGLIVGLIAAVIIAAVALLGTQLNGLFHQVTQVLPTPAAG